MLASATRRKTRARASRGARAMAPSATSAYAAAESSAETASNAVAEGGCSSESIAAVILADNDAHASFVRRGSGPRARRARGTGRAEGIPRITAGPGADLGRRARLAAAAAVDGSRRCRAAAEGGRRGRSLAHLFRARRIVGRGAVDQHGIDGHRAVSRPALVADAR